MGRIRSIKPEFTESETMGRVSRDARLTFILLWTKVDDAGRWRGGSSLLASVLYPYDPDARSLMDGWLLELESEGCIQRWRTDDGNHYLQITNWSKHQKIDRPTPSKLPEPPAGLLASRSRILANPRECPSSPRESSRPARETSMNFDEPKTRDQANNRVSSPRESLDNPRESSRAAIEDSTKIPVGSGSGSGEDQEREREGNPRDTPPSTVNGAHPRNHSQGIPLDLNKQTKPKVGHSELVEQTWLKVCQEFVTALGEAARPVKNDHVWSWLSLDLLAHSQADILLAVRWALTSDHQRAEFLRKNGVTAKTVLKPENLCEYVELAKRPPPKKRVWNPFGDDPPAKDKPE